MWQRDGYNRVSATTYRPTEKVRQPTSQHLAGPVTKALSPDVPGKGLRAAEDRGFEPRRASRPNRISSPITGA
jgi:hypothetical protein